MKMLPYTPRFKLAIAKAHEAARTAGNAYVGTEHLLAGLVSCGGGPGHNTLATLTRTDQATFKNVVLRAVAQLTSAPTHWMGFQTEHACHADAEAKRLQAKLDRLALRMDAACAAY